MVKLNSGKSWLKSADVSTGDTLKFLDEGAWVESSQYTYEDGTPRKQFVIRVEVAGEEKDMSLNKVSRTNLTEGYGDETAGWVGVVAKIEKVKVMVAGEMKDSLVLHPTGNALGAKDDKDLGVEVSEEAPF